MPQELRTEYIARRKTFLPNLKKYFITEISTNPGNFTDDDVVEVQKTLEFLNTL